MLFPVQVVSKTGDRLEEVYLSLEQGKLTETIHPLSNDKINQYLDSFDINLLDPQYPANYRTEVNLNVSDWLSTLSAKLERGYILTIDYGYSAEKYYRPSRNQGTLQCYFSTSSSQTILTLI